MWQEMESSQQDGGQGDSPYGLVDPVLRPCWGARTGNPMQDMVEVDGLDGQIHRCRKGSERCEEKRTDT